MKNDDSVSICLNESPHPKVGKWNAEISTDPDLVAPQ